MALSRSIDHPALDVAGVQLSRVHSDGCGRHSHLSALLESGGASAARDLCDSVHLLCSLHGRHPGMFDLALQRATSGPAQAWLARASEAFQRERAYLVRLTSAVGPIPSTPGAAETENSLAA